MDDKVFELIEKMYSDLNSKMDNINSEMQEKQAQSQAISLGY